MVLRVCLLLAVLALARAQSGMGNFDASLAQQTRNTHFYCLEYGQTEANFPTDESAQNTNEITTYRRWTVFLQYPVLSYLDSNRKPALFEAISALIEMPLSQFCVATVENHRVSYYDESVLVSFYFLTNPNDPNSILEDQDVLRRINENFIAAVNMGTSRYLRNFFGRTALLVNTSRSGLPNENVHPGAVMDEYDPARDPTLNAVVLGSWMGNRTLAFALEQELRPFADNPNPRSLGLEAGDIVFSVFGSIFLALLGGAIFLGFCIHPFFLS